MVLLWGVLFDGCYHRFPKEDNQLWLNVIDHKHYTGLRPRKVDFVDCIPFQIALNITGHEQWWDVLKDNLLQNLLEPLLWWRRGGQVTVPAWRCQCQSNLPSTVDWA